MEALQEEKEAVDLLQSGQLLLAKYLFAKLCKKFPHRAKLHFNHALALYKLQQYKDALDEVTTGLWLQPDDKKERRFKKEILARISITSINEKNKVVSSKPVGTMSAQASSNQIEGDHPPEHGSDEGSRRSSESSPAIEQDGEEPRVVMAEQREISEEAESRAKPVESEPRETLTEQELGNLVMQILELRKSVKNEAVASDDLRLQEALTTIKKTAQALYESAQYEQSLLLYSTILTYFPEDLEALFNTGFCQRELGDFHDSETTFKHIIELFYDNAYAWHNLALIYAMTGEGDKELYCLRKAREFGYFVDFHHTASLELKFIARNPFDGASTG